MPLSSARNFIPCTFSSFFLVSTLLSLPSVSAVNLRRSPSPSSPPSPGGSPGAYSLYPYPDSDPNPIVPDYSYGSPPSQSSTSGAGAQDYGYPQNFSEPQNPYSQSSYPQDDYAQDPTYPQDPYARSPSSQNLYSQDPSSSIPYSPIPGTENPYTSANDTSSIGNISYNSPFGSPISHLTAGSSPNIAEYLTNPDVEPIALCSPNSSSDPPDSTGCHYAMTDLKGEVKWYDKSGPTDWGPSGSGTEAVCGKQWTGSSCVITIGCQTQFQATYSDISNLASYVISNCVSDPVDGKVAPGIGYYNDFSAAPWWITVTESASHTDTSMQDFIADLSIYTSQGGFGSEVSQSQIGGSSAGRPSLDLSTQGGRPGSAGVPSSNQGDYSTQGNNSNLGEDPSSMPGEDLSDYGPGDDSNGSGSGNGNGDGSGLAAIFSAMGLQPSPTVVQTSSSATTSPPLISLISGELLQYSTSPPTTTQTDPTKPGGPTA